MVFGTKRHPENLGRRSDDNSWLQSHHLMIGLLGSILAASAYVFTTFATIHYVDAKDDQIVKHLDEVANRYEDRNKEMDRKLNLILHVVEQKSRR